VTDIYPDVEKIKKAVNESQVGNVTFSNGDLNTKVNSRRDGVISVANGDISGGVEADLPPATKWTLFLHVNGAIDVSIYLSPDGVDWFEIPESPRSFASAGDDVIEVGYTARKVKLVGSNTTAVLAKIHYVV